MKADALPDEESETTRALQSDVKRLRVNLSKFRPSARIHCLERKMQRVWDFFTLKPEGAARVGQFGLP